MANAAQNFRTNALTYAELQSIFTGEEYRPFIEFVSGLLSDLVYSSGLIDENTEDIEDLTVRVDKNEQDIAYNFQYLHGSPLYSDDFSEDSDYIEGDFVTFDGNEYIAKQNITAGAFNPSQWRLVSTANNVEFINQTRAQASSLFTAARYGAVSLESTTGLADIVVGVWQTLPMDTNVLSVPKSVVQGQSTNSLIFTASGVYSASIFSSLTFDGVSNIRTLIFRLYNADDNTQVGSIYSLPVGTDSDSANLSASIPVEIASSDVGDNIVLQVSALEPFTTISNANNLFFASGVSEDPDAL